MANDLFSSINKILENTKLDSVTAENGGRDNELPDGYYYCEVLKAEIKESSKGDPMAALTLGVVESGVNVIVEEDGSLTKEPIENTKNRRAWMYYVLKDETSVRRFVSDMLKFEGEEEGESLLPREAFTTAETIADALSCLVGSRIFMHVSTTKSKATGEDMTWKNLVSFKRADALELM